MIFDYGVEITSQIVEAQDEIILQTIQQIGGKEFRHITVDRNKVLEALTDYVKKQTNKSACAEVKHGRWKKTLWRNSRMNYYVKGFICSSCNSFEEVAKNYCPHCGVRMDGK